MNHHFNIVRIKAVANCLGSLKDKVVFVGGATVSLYPDRKILEEVRPTDDVDIIVEIINFKERGKIEEQLRNRGFVDEIVSGISCRFKVQGIIVDVMPTADPSIGFANRWYPEGFKESIEYEIDSNLSVKILSAPYFIATKLEAFKNRGGNDGRLSHDFEDIVFVLENRNSIWQEFDQAKKDLKEYLKSEFSECLKNPNFFEWIDCHVERASPPASYWINEKLEDFIGR